MTKEEINLIEELIYATVQYKFRETAPSPEIWEIAEDIQDIKKKLENV